MTVIDSHLHLWDLETGEYPWLGPQHGPLYRSILPGEAARELDEAGVTAAVLVQAEDSETDTRFMLDVADEAGWVCGVVGWLCLEDPGTTSRQLDDYGAHPAFRGVRHLVHEDPRDDFLKLPGVRKSLGLMAERRLPLDVPDAWPRHLAGLAELADALPALTIVVDHLGKPPRDATGLEQWAAVLHQVAARPNTVAKVSGLQTPGEPLTVAAVRPAWEVALETFGPGRLMYGGDWPMTLPQGGYEGWWRVFRALIEELSTDERAAVLTDTATEVYHLETTRV